MVLFYFKYEILWCHRLKWRWSLFWGAKSLQPCPTLCDPMNHCPAGSSVHGILQAGILEWVPCPPPGYLPNSGIKPVSLTSTVLAGGFFTPSVIWEALALDRTWVFIPYPPPNSKNQSSSLSGLVNNWRQKQYIYILYMLICTYHCCCLLTKSCLTLGDPMDCNRPGSSVHRISQTRILGWVAIFFFRGSS